MYVAIVTNGHRGSSPLRLTDLRGLCLHCVLQTNVQRAVPIKSHSMGLRVRVDRMCLWGVEGPDEKSLLNFFGSVLDNAGPSPELRTEWPRSGSRLSIWDPFSSPGEA